MAPPTGAPMGHTTGLLAGRPKRVRTISRDEQKGRDVQVLAAVTSAADNGGNGSGISGLIFPLLIVLLIVYFFSTQRRRARAQQQQLSQIVPGTLVLTTAGLYATVVETDGQDVLLEIAPDVVCRFGRNAIARVISAPETGGEEDTDGHEPEGGAAATDTHGDDASGAGKGDEAGDGDGEPAEGPEKPRKEL